MSVQVKDGEQGVDLRKIFPVGLFFVLLLSGCTGGAVVFAPTPAPPDATPLSYVHPSGAFTIVLPRNWSVFVQPHDQLALASFAAPDSEQPLMQVAVVNTGQMIPEQDMAGIVASYQANIRPDLLRYTEQDRQAMGDDSWRMTGMRTLPGGSQVPVNTFLQYDGAYLAVVETQIPEDAPTRELLQTIVNTLEIRRDAGLEAATLNTLADIAPAMLEIVEVSTWTTDRGVFYIAGGVVNRGLQPVEALQVRAVLNTADGTGIAEAVDRIMGYVLAPGQFAPFSLRFGQGQSPQSNNYTLELIPTNILQTTELVSPDVISWTYDNTAAPEGQVYVTVTAENTGDTPVRTPLAIVSAFDAAGDMVAAAYSPASMDVLEPGGTAVMTVLIAEAGGQPETFEVNVQAPVCDTGCE